MHKEDEFVQCPYYRKDTPQTINCEGISEDTGLKLGFANKAQFREFKRRYCRCLWQRCPVANMLNQMYEYDPQVP